ncbi:Sex-determining fem-1 [Fusarium mexicanum]|uniref:Sex-determining fem-1 n=1 Tax=Fusarium mexicanum TaxID=751941 RepID=A0A8H5MVI3_9HYPO|nr:Sex-determining fem-1 [Fusarium mexicanum]
MPEWYPGEHIKSSQNLLAGPTAESLSERLKVMVYMLSNSMLNGNHDEIFTSLIDIENADIRTHFKKLRNENPTIRASLERLFWLEINEATWLRKPMDEQRPLGLITWLLQLGQDPNCSVHLNSGPVWATPIREAIEAGYLELVQLLVRFQAQAELPKGSTCEEGFVNLTLDARCSDVEKTRVLNFLFDHQFLSNDEMLRAAIELSDIVLMTKVLQCDPDVTNYETTWRHPAQRRERSHFQTYLRHSSALMMAIQAGGPMADLMLDYLLQKGQPEPSILVDASLAAAYGTQHALMLRLDEIRIPEKMCNAEGITPLHAAVVGGDSTVCKYLLERHGGSSTSLILAAAILGNVDIVQLLIEYGGNPNAPLCRLDNEWYDYFNIPQIGRRYSQAMLSTLLNCEDYVDPTEGVYIVLIQNGATLEPGNVAELSRRGYYRCLEVALKAGGNPNDEGKNNHTALQCALDGSWSSEDEEQTSKRFLTVDLLIKAGANLRGGEVVRAIDHHEQEVLFYLLRNRGTLNDVDETGKCCLEAEINAHNDPFLQEILEGQEFPIDAGPFCAAILENDWDLLERLFERVRIPTDCHLLEGTAVGLAAEAGEVDILNKLLARFTHPSVLVSAILPFAIGEMAIVECRRYCNGSTYWRPSTEGYRIEGSPLALAALGRCTHGFRELLHRGCSMDRISWNVVAESERTSEYLEVLREFRSGSGMPRQYDSKLNSALCSAIRKRNHDLMRYLVEVGADVNELDLSPWSSKSPLQTAVRHDEIDMAAYLLENKANVNAPPAFSAGTTALQAAAIRGHIGLALRLIQLGARVNTRGAASYGTSALEGAAQHGSLDMVALLLHHGAVTTGRGRQQLVISAVFAHMGGYQCIITLLKDECGWTDADQDLSKLAEKYDGYPHWQCLRSYCCDEYHDGDTECVYHYTEEQRRLHYRTCKKCLKLEAKEEKGHDIDDWNESSLSSEEEDLDSEGAEY